MLPFLWKHPNLLLRGPVKFHHYFLTYQSMLDYNRRRYETLNPAPTHSTYIFSHFKMLPLKLKELPLKLR